MDNKDILGVRPIGETVKSTIDKTIDCVSVFLKAVCLPASEEFGLMFQDKVRTWRLTNIIKVLEKAEGKLIFHDDKLQLRANPKVALSIIDNASLIDDEELQTWWAGLFASSCTEDGKDDQNLIFVNLLKDLTSFEVKLLGYCCINCQKYFYPDKLIVPYGDFRLSIDEITRITGVSDISRMDREIDHMISIGLFSTGIIEESGFNIDKGQIYARLTPSALALNLFYKANAAVNTPPDVFWGDTLSLYPIKN